MRTHQEPGVLGALTDLNFERFATPSVVKFVYVVGIVLTALCYVAGVIGFFVRGFGLGVAALVAGGVVAVFALLLLRVTCEFVAAVVRLSEDVHRRG